MKGREGMGCAFWGRFGGGVGDGMVGWLRNETRAEGACLGW